MYFSGQREFEQAQGEVMGLGCSALKKPLKI